MKSNIGILFYVLRWMYVNGIFKYNYVNENNQMVIALINADGNVYGVAVFPNEGSDTFVLSAEDNVPFEEWLQGAN